MFFTKATIGPHADGDPNEGEAIYIGYESTRFQTPAVVLTNYDLSHLFQAMGREDVLKKISGMWPQDDGAGRR